MRSAFKERQKSEPKRVKSSLVFSLGNRVGSLAEILHIGKDLSLNLTHIESRPSKDQEWDYEFFVDLDGATQEKIKEFSQVLEKKNLGVVKLVQSEVATEITNQGVPWFPKKHRDLDTFADKVLEYGEDLDADHPGFKDAEYRERRKTIVENAKLFKHGDKIPPIEYRPEELETWRKVYTELKKLFPTHACKQHNYIFPLLEQNCGYSENSIPQLQDISEFLMDCTGWRLRPVMGLLSSRDFLNGLAFRVFHSTQYIRHHSKPFYTPEPDVCHELIGHVPLFADPEFADFSQEVGLASLGASEEDIERLATIYWFTVEFGLCREGDKEKAYGAGLLSSFGELEYCLSDKPKKIPFDPKLAADTKYPITQFQPTYYVTDSFEDAKKKVKEFAEGLDRPFVPYYNPYTQTIEILDNKEKVVRLTQNIHSEVDVLRKALKRL